MERWSLRILIILCSPLALAFACVSDKDPQPDPEVPALTDAQVSAFENELRADSYRLMELAEAEPEKTMDRLLAAAKTKPDSPVWYAAMQMCVAGDVYQARQLDPRARRTRFASVQQSLERMLSVADVSSIKSAEAISMFQSFQTETAGAALEAGNVERAEHLARQALDASTRGEAWNRPNVVHEAHTVLGRAALRREHSSRAKEHLLASGRVRGTAQLSSFGPSFLLARELLEHGESEERAAVSRPRELVLGQSGYRRCEERELTERRTEECA